MAGLAVELSHIGGGCNRTAHCVAWGSDSIVAYGSSSNCIIYDVDRNCALWALQGHTGDVTSVCWVPSRACPPRIASAQGLGLLCTGATDGTICIWLVDFGSVKDSKRLATIRAEDGPLTSLQAAKWAPEDFFLLIATAGGPGATLHTCRCRWPGGEAAADTCEVEVAALTRLSRGPSERQALCSAWLAIPGTSDASDECLVALGAVDGSVHLWGGQLGGSLSHLTTLPAGDNWVTGVALAPDASEGRSDGPQDSPSPASGDSNAARLLLAASSQDRSTRIWTIEAPGPSTTKSDGVDALAPRSVVQIAGRTAAVRLDSLLLGHEDWVHSVAWLPCALTDTPSLLTASMDRTMVVWRRDAGSGVWMACETLGDAGPSSLGYFCGRFTPSGNKVVANGYTGSLHLWCKGEVGPAGRLAGEFDGAGGSGLGWRPMACATGHTGAVVDVAWGGLPSAPFLLSASVDQTVRLLGRNALGRWCEMARPQVHGHDFSCLASLPAEDGRPYCYASGSEEKVIRVFEAPTTVIESIAAIQGAPLPPGMQALVSSTEMVPMGGSVPALGLSNQALFRQATGTGVPGAAGTAGGPHGSGTAGPMGNDGGADGGGDDGGFHMDLVGESRPGVVTTAPLEEHLSQNTLWPEVQKLYGHGDDLYAMAADPTGRFVASACVARTAPAAAVWMWDARTWHPVGQLEGPSLTVTQLRFSRSGRLLVAAGRDRSVHLYARRAAGSETASGCPWRHVAAASKAHLRVVWSADVSHDDALVASAARDGTVKVWAAGSEAWDGETGPGALREVCSLPQRDASVTAVAWAPGTAGAEAYILGVATEAGAVEVWSVPMSSQGPQTAMLWQAEGFARHAGPVKRLAWTRDPEHASAYLLASCGADHGVRVFLVRVPSA